MKYSIVYTTQFRGVLLLNHRNFIKIFLQLFLCFTTEVQLVYRPYA